MKEFFFKILILINFSLIFCSHLCCKITFDNVSLKKLTQGWTGDKCQYGINECQSAPCLNGGRCVDQVGAYMCNCSATGYNGTNCEIDINECTSTPLLSKCVNGTCNNMPATYNCSCTLGFTGQFCETNINDCSTSNCVNGGIVLLMIFRSRKNIKN